jgi:hypothetical protein
MFYKHKCIFAVSLHKAISVMKHFQIIMFLVFPSLLHILLGGVLCGSSSDAFVWTILAPMASLWFMANEGRKLRADDTDGSWPQDQVRKLACSSSLYMSSKVCS